jgi:hypothetical protein
MLGADGSDALVSFPSGKINLTINTGKLSGEKPAAWRPDPRQELFRVRPTKTKSAPATVK